MTKVKVWDLLTRIFHWSLVGAFATAWNTEDHYKDLHEVAGYTVLGLIAFRVIYGFVGAKHSRFSDFVVSPVTVINYLKNLLAGRHQSHLGHNPVAGYMVIALLASVTLAALTGWMMEFDMFWIASICCRHSLTRDQRSISAGSKALAKCHRPS